MTVLQQVVWELEMEYVGHPYYVTGNAILHALSDQLSYPEQQALRVSHGIFAPGQFGKYPDDHSNNGTRPGIGSSLPDVETYADLWLCRQPEMRWLLDSRPRDALNTHDVKRHREEYALAPTEHIGQQTTWYVHAYLHSDQDGPVPLDADRLDGLQFGGRRNYGFGEVALKDRQTVVLDELDYSRIRSADDHLLAVVTPYVLASEYPHTDNHDIPWWWDYEHDLRRRREQIVEQRTEHSLETVDHGQVVGYAGDEPVATARNGLERVGPHAKYGFGELRVIPLQ